MSDPIVDPADLATYLDDPNINEGRAELMIELAQHECEGVLYPLPQSARVVVLRVAQRGYLTTRSPRQYQKEQAGYDGQDVLGGIYLTAQDKADLMRYGSNTASVYSVALSPPWNVVDYTQ